MDSPFPLNHNPNTLIPPNISSATLREQYRQKLNRHTFSESNIQYQANEPFKIILDDVIKLSTFFVRNSNLKKYYLNTDFLKFNYFSK